MTIQLPPSQTRKVNEFLKSGDYATPAQVLADGLRLLEARNADRAKIRARLRLQILAGARQVRARRVLPLDSSVAADIKARGRRRLANAKPARRAGHP